MNRITIKKNSHKTVVSEVTFDQTYISFNDLNDVTESNIVNPFGLVQPYQSDIYFFSDFLLQIRLISWYVYIYVHGVFLIIDLQTNLIKWVNILCWLIMIKLIRPANTREGLIIKIKITQNDGLQMVQLHSFVMQMQIIVHCQRR